MSESKTPITDANMIDLNECIAITGPPGGRRFVKKYVAAHITGQLEQDRAELIEALSEACADGIEEACDECSPGPCAGCWVSKARSLLARLKERS